MKTKSLQEVWAEAPVGYHVRKIVKGKIGEASKILEEATEFMDAVEQNVSLMALQELSDLYGAIDAYLKTNYPSISMEDLALMARITERVFQNGFRS